MKILIITYYWPPAGGPGVQRWLRLANYLAEHGAQPIVLTVDPTQATYPLRDDSLAALVSDKVRVEYSATREVFGLYQKASGRKEVPFSGFANESDRPGPRQKLARFVRGNFFLPDARKAWNAFAYKKACKLVEDENIGVVITSGPPHSTHLIGKKLQKGLGVQWLADFRDPWTDIYYYHKMYPTAAARLIDRRMERQVLEAADMVLCVSTDLKRLFEAKSPKVDPDKVKVLPNGFDPAEFAVPEREKQAANPVRIGYTGTITAQYPLEALLQALCNQFEKEELQLVFAGRRDQVTQKILERYQDRIHIELVDYLPKSELIPLMLQCHALLLMIPDIPENKGIVTGKIFDYLAAQRPIVGLGPKEGDAAKLLKETGTGRMWAYGEEEEAAAFVCELHNNRNPLQRNEEAVARYSRSVQARQLLDWIYQLAGV